MSRIEKLGLPGPRRLSMWLALGLAATMNVTSAQAGDQEPEPTRTVVVGKATLNWHLNPSAVSQSTRELLEAYRQVTEPDAMGAKRQPAEAPEPLPPNPLAPGVTGVRLPVELISTMYYDLDKGQYCSDPASERASRAARDLPAAASYAAAAASAAPVASGDSHANR